MVAEQRIVPLEDHPGYGVSRDGRVWTRIEAEVRTTDDPTPLGDVWREMSQRVGTNGYATVTLYKNRGTEVKTWYVHRLMLTVFDSEPPTKRHQAAHLNGNRLDNRVANLQWKTRKENEKDKDRHGTRPIGEDQPMAKFSNEIVKRVRLLYASGLWRQSELCRIFNASPNNICHIISGHTYPSVGGPIFKKPHRPTFHLDKRRRK